MNTTIYKKDSNNNIRFLTISTEDNIIVQKSGIVGTDSPVYNRSFCESKNLGKVNSVVTL